MNARLHRPVRWIALLIVGMLFAGCGMPSTNGVTQVATIDALLAGVYDGHMSLHTLRQFGDFGLGTYDRLDGEMLLLDGAFYQVRDDGTVNQPAGSTLTPFAAVTHFVSDYNRTIGTPTDMPALESLIDAAVPEPNRIVAFIVRGRFDSVLARSVPAQSKPYPPLAEVTKRQSEFPLSDVEGTLIGFRLPAFVGGVNVPGYHMHFLSADEMSGGHVLAFELGNGVLEMDTSHDSLHVYLPTQSEAFNTADLEQDRTQELESVEKETQSDMAGEPTPANQ